MKKTAVLSPCRKYRYELHREWGDGGMCAFIGLNPSTADETEDDPTIRRCIGFAKSWGYGSLCMINLFAFRATQPADMKKALDPVGPQNLATLEKIYAEARIVVAAWGAHGTYKGQGAICLRKFPGLHYLSLTSSGAPGHPLYLKSDLRPKPFNSVVKEDWE